MLRGGMARRRHSGAGGSGGLQQSGRIGGCCGPAVPIRRGAPGRDCYSVHRARAGIGRVAAAFAGAYSGAYPGAVAPAGFERRRRGAVAGAAMRCRLRGRRNRPGRDRPGPGGRAGPPCEAGGCLTGPPWEVGAARTCLGRARAVRVRLGRWAPRGPDLGGRGLRGPGGAAELVCLGRPGSGEAAGAGRPRSDQKNPSLLGL